MKVLVLAGDGMLGHKMFQVFNEKHDTHATFKEEWNYSSAFPVYKDIPKTRIHLGMDALNESTFKSLIVRIEPDLVINCIGIIKQLDEASSHTLLIEINSLLPHRLADICSSLHAKFVHISTDCVFSGSKGNYSEDDPSDALDLYGKSKSLGEVDYSPHLTVRTSIIGREWVRSTGLLEWLISQRGGTVRGYKNAIFSGFTTEALSRLLRKTLSERPDITGLRQLSSNPISKLELLTRINDAWGLDINIQPYDNPPCDRSLDSSMFFTETGFKIPSWDCMINKLVVDDIPYDEWREHNRILIR